MHESPVRTDRRTFIRTIGCCSTVLALVGCGALSQQPPPSVPPATVLATVPIDKGPIMLTLSPDGTRVYAASLDRLSAIDTASNTVVGTIGIGAYPAGLAVSPDGHRAYLTELFSIRLDAFDTVTMTALEGQSLFAQAIVGGYGRLALSPNGSTAYVTNGPNSRMTVVDLAGRRASDVLLDMQPEDVVFGPDGTRAYLCGCKNFCTTGTVEVMDAATQNFGATISVGPRPYRILVNPAGTRAYTNNLADGTVSVVDLSANTTLVNIPVGPEPTGLAVSPDGRTVYTTGLHTGVLTAIDTATNRVRGGVFVGGKTREVVISKDGRRAYVSTMDAVHVIDTAALRGGGN